MACSLTLTNPAGEVCSPVKPGLDELKHWLIDRASITLTESTPGSKIYTSFTIASGAALLPWNFDKRGFIFTDEMTVDENTGARTFNPTIAGRILELSGTAAKKVESLINTNLVSIFAAKNGTVIVAGSKGGLDLTVNTTGSASDAFGEAVSLGSSDEPEKHYQLLMTDLATTLAALVAAETAASS